MFIPTLTEALYQAEEHGYHGLAYQHVVLCPTRTWLFLRRLDCAHLSPAMQRGLFVHETSYQETRGHAMGLGIHPDHIDFRQHVVSEVKARRTQVDAARQQLAFYVATISAATGTLWSGLLRYPSQRRVEPLLLHDSWQQRLVEATNQLHRLEHMPTPPRPERKPVCRGCSYSLLCWGQHSEED